MDIINWQESFSVGVSEMDSQHKKLIGMINRLIKEQKVLTNPETIAELLTEMTDYVEEHFRAEEYLMAEYGYERKSIHEQMHKEFTDKTISFCSATDIGPNILSNALLEYLSSWLVDHILAEDMKYKDFFRDKGLT